MGNFMKLLTPHLMQAGVGLIQNALEGVRQRTALQPLYQENTELAPWKKSLEAISLGVGDGNWSRRDQRRFRKLNGWSKLDMRNWKAELLGLKTDRDYNRRDLRVFENYKLGNNPVSDFYARKALNVDSNGNALVEKARPTYILSGTYEGQPIIEEVIEEEPIPGQASPVSLQTPLLQMSAPYSIPLAPLILTTFLVLPEVPILKSADLMASEYFANLYQQPELPYAKLPQQFVQASPITYNFGNQMNKYWSDQAQKVFGNLSQDELYKISGNDGEISYDDAIAWQQGIGAGKDGKFGSGTIGAMNTKYGLNAMTDYKNPVKENNTSTTTRVLNPVNINNVDLSLYRKSYPTSLAFNSDVMNNYSNLLTQANKDFDITNYKFDQDPNYKKYYNLVASKYNIDKGWLMDSYTLK